MRIRDIKEEERELFMEMEEDFYSPENGASLHAAERENLEATFSLCLMKNPYARLLMVEDEEGKAAGFCLLAFTWSNEMGGMVVWVEEMYFKPETRGQGYGTRVFAWLEEEYKEAKRFRLEATPQNQAAIKLYERMGFEELPYYQMAKDQG